MDLGNIKYNLETGEIVKKVDYRQTKDFFKYMMHIHIGLGYTVEESIDKIFELLEKIA